METKLSETNSDSENNSPEKLAMDRRRFLRIGGVALGVTLTAGAIVRKGRHYGQQAAIHVEKSCLGCTGCVVLCPVDAITPDSDGIVVDTAKCNLCGFCMAACPVRGITVSREG